MHEPEHSSDVHHEAAAHVPRVTDGVRALVACEGKVRTGRHSRADDAGLFVDLDQVVDDLPVGIAAGV